MIVKIVHTVVHDTSVVVWTVEIIGLFVVILEEIVMFVLRDVVPVDGYVVVSVGS